MMLVDNAAISLVDSGRLHAELRRLTALSSSALEEAAPIYRELVSRGEDVSYLSKATCRVLDLISVGKLAPEAGVSFGGSLSKIEQVSRLPIPEQKKFASGAKVQVPLHVRENGMPEKFPATRLTSRQLGCAVDRTLGIPTETCPRSGDEQEPRPVRRRLTVHIPQEHMDKLLHLAVAMKVSVTEAAETLLRNAIESSEAAAA